jgi:hypothetical protein
MNAREALLKKRVRYLEAQVEALMYILEHVESVANGFAFDLAFKIDPYADHDAYTVVDDALRRCEGK